MNEPCQNPLNQKRVSFNQLTDEERKRFWENYKILARQSSETPPETPNTSPS